LFLPFILSKYTFTKNTKAKKKKNKKETCLSCLITQETPTAFQLTTRQMPLLTMIDMSIN